MVPETPPNSQNLLARRGLFLTFKISACSPIFILLRVVALELIKFPLSGQFFKN